MSPKTFLTAAINCTRYILYLILITFITLDLSAQKVGIGTLAPQRLLSVNGSIMLDQGNKNNGSIDSAALVFGSSSLVGILSRKTIGENKDGIDIITNGLSRLSIGSGGTVGIDGNTNIGGNLNLGVDGIVGNNFRVNGRIGIGGATDASYQLFVHGGNSYFEGNTITIGNSDITGALTLNGAGIVGSNFRVNGRIGIGGATNASYQLIVNNGNSYFDGNTTNSGNATVNGTVNAVGNLIIKGNGHVRSNGSSNLRVGFDQVSYDVVVNGNSYADITANITDFDGTNSDIRVYPCQVTGSPNASANAYVLRFQTMAVNATDDTCKVRIINPTGSAILAIGTIYLMSVVKD